MYKDVIFFYCEQADHSRDSLSSVLRELLAQLIRLNPNFMPLICYRLSQSAVFVLDSIEVLTDLTERALGTAQNL